MNATARAEFQTVKVEDWNTLGYLDRLGPNAPNLKNYAGDVLPFLKFRNERRPSGHEQIWTLLPGQKKADMKVIMDNALRLASNILRSPAGVRYIYYLAKGPRFKNDSLTWIEKTPVYSFEPPRPEVPYPEMKQTVEDIFECLARFINLSFFDESDDPEEKDAVLGRTEARRDGPLRSAAIDLVGDRNRVGVASVIEFNFKLVSNIQELRKRGYENSLEILNANFNFAVTIVHEFMHVIHIATSAEELVYYDWFLDGAKPDRRPFEGRPLEPLFQGEGVLETGRSAENFIFGGSIEKHPKYPHGAARFFEWPNFLDESIGNDYLVRWLRNPGPTRKATEYFVPKHFLQNIHQQAFWDRVQPHHVSALYIAKQVGLIEVNDGNYDEDWDSSDSSEGGPWAPKQPGDNRVFREQDDPSESRANQPFEMNAIRRYTAIKWKGELATADRR